jgi:hypothetical protein
MYDQFKKKKKNKLAEKQQLVSSQQWNRPNDMFGLPTICFFRQDDDDDVEYKGHVTSGVEFKQTL